MSVAMNPGDIEEFADLCKNQYRGVHHYRDTLSLLYAKAENYQLSLDRWKVSKIRTFKDKGSLVKHEYLVATLFDADGRELDLRMERRVKESSAMNVITESLGVVGSASTRTVSANVGTQEKDGKFRKWAADEISICSSDTFDDTQLQVDHFRFQGGHPVSLPQLVVLACAISEYSATYHIALSNCYWFCYVASKALKKRFNHTLEPVGDSGQLGCCYGIPLYLRSNIQEVVTKVLESYDETWKYFRDEVSIFIPPVDRTAHTILLMSRTD